jgi:hypothetical protein
VFALALTHEVSNKSCTLYKAAATPEAAETNISYTDAMACSRSATVHKVPSISNVKHRTSLNAPPSVKGNSCALHPIHTVPAHLCRFVRVNFILSALSRLSSLPILCWWTERQMPCNSLSPRAWPTMRAVHFACTTSLFIQSAYTCLL